MSETERVRLDVTVSSALIGQYADELMLLGRAPSGKRPVTVSYELEVDFEAPPFHQARLRALARLLSDPAIGDTLVIGDGTLGALFTAIRGAHG